MSPRDGVRLFCIPHFLMHVRQEVVKLPTFCDLILPSLPLRHDLGFRSGRGGQGVSQILEISFPQPLATLFLGSRCKKTCISRLYLLSARQLDYLN